jgi:hypothetical protein
VAPRCGRATLVLFALNLALQVFDAVATYVGCHAGMVEGNPLVAYAMACFGVGPGLALAKVQALALLGLLWYLRTNWLVPRALAITAVTYAAFSTVPWSVALFLPPPA